MIVKDIENAKWLAKLLLWYVKKWIWKSWKI